MRACVCVCAIVAHLALAIHPAFPGRLVLLLRVSMRVCVCACVCVCVYTPTLVITRPGVKVSMWCRHVLMLPLYCHRLLIIHLYIWGCFTLYRPKPGQ